MCAGSDVKHRKPSDDSGKDAVRTAEAVASYAAKMAKCHVTSPVHILRGQRSSSQLSRLDLPPPFGRRLPDGLRMSVAQLHQANAD